MFKITPKMYSKFIAWSKCRNQYRQTKEAWWGMSECESPDRLKVLLRRNRKKGKHAQVGFNKKRARRSVQKESKGKGCVTLSMFENIIKYHIISCVPKSTYKAYTCKCAHMYMV